MLGVGDGGCEVFVEAWRTGGCGSGEVPGEAGLEMGLVGDVFEGEEVEVGTAGCWKQDGVEVGAYDGNAAADEELNVEVFELHRVVGEDVEEAVQGGEEVSASDQERADGVYVEFDAGRADISRPEGH